MNTVRHYLNKLPRGYRERALANVERPTKLVSKISEAIDAGFTWHGSPEGAEFWYAVCQHYESGEMLPALPGAQEPDVFDPAVPLKIVPPAGSRILTNSDIIREYRIVDFSPSGKYVRLRETSEMLTDVWMKTEDLANILVEVLARPEEADLRKDVIDEHINGRARS